MVNRGTKRLETDRLILRQFRPEDAESMLRNWASDCEVTRFLTWPPHTDIGVTRQLLSDWIGQYEEPSFYNWGLELKETRIPNLVDVISEIFVKAALYGKSLVGKGNYAGGAETGDCLSF